MGEVENMLSCTTEMVEDFINIQKLVLVPYLRSGRQEAIRWIKSHLPLHPEEMDLAVQVLDKFLKNFPEEPDIEFNADFFKLVGSTCLVISSKFHNFVPAIAFENFPQFDAATLEKYEFLVLSTISFDFNARAVPANFVRCLVNTVDNSKLKSLLCSTAESLICEFWTIPESALYAPSTIAITAVATAFSILEISCESWMKSVPEIYFSCAIPSNHTSILDVAGCFKSFSLLPLTKRYLSNVEKKDRVSPVSVSSLHLEENISRDYFPVSPPNLDLEDSRGPCKRRKLNDDISDYELDTVCLLKPIPLKKCEN